MKISGILLSLLFSFLFSLWTHKEELSDDYSIYGDAGIYYVLNFSTAPGSMDKDLLFRSLGGGPISGMGGVKIFSGFLQPVETAAARVFGLRKMLLVKAIGLQTITGGAALTLALALGFGGWAWGFLVLFMAYFSTTDAFFGGLHREYGPLLCLALYYCAEKGFLAGVLAVFAGFYLLYGASLPFAGCVVALTLLAGKTPRQRRAGLALLVLTAAAPFLMRLFEPGFIHVLGIIYSSKGGVDVTGLLPLEIYFLNVNDHSQLYRWFTWGLLAAAGAVLIFYRFSGRKIPRGDKLFFGAIVFSFVCVYLMNPGLASRQTVQSLPLLLVLVPFRYLVSMGAGRGRTFALLGFSVLPLAVFLFSGRSLNPINHVSPAAMRAAVALPKDSLILAHPETERMLGFFTGRVPYSNEKWEEILCGFRRSPFCEEAKARNAEVFDVYYSSSPAALAGFAAKSGVTQFLVEEQFYLPEYLEGRGQYNRFRAGSARALASGGTALLDLARKQGVELAPGVYLLEAGRLKGGRK